MPFPRKSLEKASLFGGCLLWLNRVLCGLIFHFLSLTLAHAIDQGDPIHFSGNKEVWNRKENTIDLIGNAAMVQVGETLTADRIYVDMNSRKLHATGNCVYNSSDSIIWGDEMIFDLDTRVGQVKGGRVSTSKFTLRGETIDKLGGGHFKTRWGEYTTCVDCAPTWSLVAEEVDMQMEGYAYFKNVTARIKDSPTFWFPYLFMPMKTRRQSGLIFPHFSFGSPNGVTFVLPYFWAIDRSADMTFGAGYFTKRGTRLEWEGRYALENGSGISTAFVTWDKEFSDLYGQYGVPNQRWVFNLDQSHHLPFGISERILFSEVSDNQYPYLFVNDTRGTQEAYLASILSFSRASPSMSLGLSLNRYRNLLNTTGLLNTGPVSNPDTSTGGSPENIKARLLAFDPKTVQVYPKLSLDFPDHMFWSPYLVGGLSLRLNNFVRGAGYFDYDRSSVPFGTTPPASAPAFNPGVDPIREALRLSMTPSLYTTLRPWDRFSLVPSLELRSYFYQFGNGIDPLFRGYLVFKTDFSTQLEKIYEFRENPIFPKAKHVIRPILTYSYIPWVQEDENHPFVKQLKYVQTQPYSGYNFDNNDIVPITTTLGNANYFVPLGNSIAYGLTSQWTRKKEGPKGGSPTYQNTVEFSAGQSLNFIELGKPEIPGQPKPSAFTRLFSVLNLSYEKFSSSTTYYYYADRIPDGVTTFNRNLISTNFTYIFERSVRQRFMRFDRSFTIGYVYSGISPTANNLSAAVSFSLSDYILPSFNFNYKFRTDDGVGGQLLTAGASLELHSPSECWKFVFNVGFNRGLSGLTFSPDFSLNLVGSGFGGVSEIATQASQVIGG